MRAVTAAEVTSCAMMVLFQGSARPAKRDCTLRRLGVKQDLGQNRLFDGDSVE